MGLTTDKIRDLIHSPKGKNVLTFLLFLVVSSILWVVLTLNEDQQRDLKCAIDITNVPDSITRVTSVPEFLHVSARAPGTAFMRYLFTDQLQLNIDYRAYARNHRLSLNDQMLRAQLRNRIGGGVQIMSLSPDSLNIYFTSSPGLRTPVAVDAHVVPGPKFALIGQVKSLTDSVMLYAVNPNDAKVRCVVTQPIVLNDVKSSQTLRVALVTPPNVRAVPDSVDVHIDVEPLISKSRLVDITPINVPDSIRLITRPNQVEVYYMVPLSTYKSTNSNPTFRIEADYREITPGNDKVAVRLTSVPDKFMNVFVDTDSVEYIIER